MGEGEESRPKSARKGRRTLLRVLVLFVLLAAIAGCIILFLKYREAVATNPHTIEQRTLEEVAEIVEVPDEKPSVLTVLDASKLTNKELAARAKSGDRLLVYGENKRIIIFRPDTGKVVDMLTIRNATTDGSEALEEPAATAPVDDASTQ